MGSRPTDTPKRRRTTRSVRGSSLIRLVVKSLRLKQPLHRRDLPRRATTLGGHAHSVEAWLSPARSNPQRPEPLRGAPRRREIVTVTFGRGTDR
jgi:hypothetical protein